MTASHSKTRIDQREPQFEIVPLKAVDLEKVKAFTDREIGEGYFSVAELHALFPQTLAKISDQRTTTCSFQLVDELGEMVGLRLAYAPGQWRKGKGNGLRPDLWSVPQDKVGYFQSLFLSDRARGGGYGPLLSRQSESVMRQAGAQAIVTHAWKESPNNSSIKYLTKAGFEFVCEHPKYWSEVDYVCTHDGKPCQCTAVEMIKYIEPPIEKVVASNAGTGENKGHKA